MNFRNLLNHSWRKPEPKCIEEKASLPQFHELYLLRSESYPCKRCPVNDDRCFKLHLKDRTICLSSHFPNEPLNG